MWGIIAVPYGNRVSVKSTGGIFVRLPKNDVKQASKSRKNCEGLQIDTEKRRLYNVKKYSRKKYSRKRRKRVKRSEGTKELFISKGI